MAREGHMLLPDAVRLAEAIHASLPDDPNVRLVVQESNLVCAGNDRKVYVVDLCGVPPRQNVEAVSLADIRRAMGDLLAFLRELPNDNPRSR